MSAETSPSTSRRYGVERVCDAGGCARSTFYARRNVEDSVNEGGQAEAGAASDSSPSMPATTPSERWPGWPSAACPGSRTDSQVGAYGAGPSTLDGVAHDRSRLEVPAVGAAAGPELVRSNRRGPKPKVSDEELLKAIRLDIAASPFVGEGYRKVWRRLRRRSKDPLHVSRKRVLRLMREAKLLSPHRLPQHPGCAHDGHIITDAPNLMWGTDGARFETVEEGLAWVFVAVEHWNAECVGVHVAKTGDRFAALEPITQGLERYFGGACNGVAEGCLAIRSDHGSQYTSDHFIKQVAFWGLKQSYAFVRQPETNGVAERFIRTLKEQVFHGRVYRTIEEAREAVRRFVETYNKEWLVEKNGLTSPLESRRMFEEEAARKRAA